MGIPIAAALNKAMESLESTAKIEAMQDVVADAEKIVENIWPEIEEPVMKQPISPSDIGREAWNKTASEVNKEVSDVPRYIITRNEMLENNRHPITGVCFERKIIELPDGEKIEGVFPNFDSWFDAKIPEDIFLQPDKIQFRECNRQLVQEIERNPELREKFSAEQIEQIYDGVYDGTAPEGYVWHHDAEVGKLQLVDFETHSHTGHTGGRSIWGGGSDNR